MKAVIFLIGIIILSGCITTQQQERFEEICRHHNSSFYDYDVWADGSKKVYCISYENTSLTFVVSPDGTYKQLQDNTKAIK